MDTVVRQASVGRTLLSAPVGIKNGAFRPQTGSADSSRPNFHQLISGLGGSYQGLGFQPSRSVSKQPQRLFINTISCNDGAYPSFITQGIDGNLYGSTGPQNFPTSVIFRMSPTGTFKVLHAFDTKAQPDGLGAFNMVQLPDGNFYGTTVAGDHLKPWNSVFRFNPTTSAYTILHPFNSPNNNMPNVAATHCYFRRPV